MLIPLSDWRACTASAILVLQEANRESAARSRDKRLKLIADLEVEVQQLKRQHAEFKVWVHASTFFWAWQLHLI